MPSLPQTIRRATLSLMLTGGMLHAADAEPRHTEDRTMPQATIQNYHGSPGLFIDEQPLFPMILFEQEIAPKDARTFQEAGVKLYSFIEKTSFLDLGWTDDYTTDYSIMERVLSTTAQRCPNGYFLPRIHLWAPDWWLEKHPEEAFFGHDESDKRNESFASELWLEQAGAALRRMVRYIEDSPYADQVIGVVLSTAQGGEWHQYGIDNTPAMERYFRNYLRNRYRNNLESLREAWQDDTVTFDNATTPDESELYAEDYGIFKDPALGRRCMDYWEAYHQVTVDAIDHFCRIVKDESNGRLLTVTLYGYSPDMNWHEKYIHHRAAGAAHRLTSLDAIAGPHTYHRRGPGKDGALRNYPASLALHGKLFIDEADDRTHLSFPKNWATLCNNLWESQQVLRRSFGNVVCANSGMWYMDHSSGEWYDAPALREDFKRINRWADYSMQLPRREIAEVAVISQPQSEFYLGGHLDWTSNMYEAEQGQLEDLCRSGAPFSKFLIDDLADGLIPDHKVYIFLDCFFLTDAERRAVEQLKRDGKTLIWYYAPGFVTEHSLSLDGMKQLTGLDFTVQDSGGVVVNLEQPTGRGLQRFGLPERLLEQADLVENCMKTELSPRFVPAADASGTTVIGRYADTGDPAMVSRKFADWTSVYVPMTPVPAEVLREIFRDAGVHIYLESNDNLAANAAWLCITAPEAGTKTVKLPEALDVYDVTGDTLIGRRLTEFQLPMQEKETKILAVGKNLPEPPNSTITE